MLRQHGGDAPLEVLAQELEDAGREVAEVPCEARVVERDEVRGIELRVRGLGESRRHVAPHHLRIDAIQVVLQVEAASLGGAELAAGQLVELVRGDLGRQDVPVVDAVQHRGEDEAVERDVVLADEVDELRVGALPPGLPRARVTLLASPLLGEAHVADGGVEPDVEHLPGLPCEAILRHGHAPRHVAGDRALGGVLQQALQEGLHVGLPRVVLDPLADPRVPEARQVQEPVLGRAPLGRRAADLARGLRQAQGIDPGPAVRALVAPSTLAATAVAGPDHVAVGQEHGVVGAVQLLQFALDQVAVVVETTEEVLGEGLVLGADAGARPGVEGDAEPVEGALDVLAPAGDVLGVADALLLRPDGDRDPVLVGPTHVQDLLTHHSQAAHVEVRRQVGARDVPEVDRAVRVGEGAGDEGAAAGHGASMIRPRITPPDRWASHPSPGG